MPPDIDDTETSSDVTVSEGENVTLTCKATGHPSPRILWRREDGDHLQLHLRPYETEKGILKANLTISRALCLRESSNFFYFLVGFGCCFIFRM